MFSRHDTAWEKNQFWSQTYIFCHSREVPTELFDLCYTTGLESSLSDCKISTEKETKIITKGSPMELNMCTTCLWNCLTWTREGLIQSTLKFWSFETVHSVSGCLDWSLQSAAVNCRFTTPLHSLLHKMCPLELLRAGPQGVHYRIL